MTATASGNCTPSTRCVPDQRARRSSASAAPAASGLGLSPPAQRGQQGRGSASADARIRRRDARAHLAAPRRWPRPRPARRAERGQLGLDQAAVVDLRVHRLPGLLVGGLGFVALPWASSTSPRRSATSAANSGAVAPSSCFERLVVLLLVEQHAGQAQPRDVWYSASVAFSATQASAAQRGVGLALVELHLGGQQAALLREGGARDSAPSCRRRRARPGRRRRPARPCRARRTSRRP